MTTLISELEQTQHELKEVAASIPDDKIDRVPFEGSWTAGQVLEHIDKSIGSGILNGNVQAVGRPADEKVQMIQTIFLDFTKRYEAPGFIVPTDAVHDKNALVSKLLYKFDKLKEVAAVMNMEELCLDFEVPGFGPFTRLEWIMFYVMHSRRHLHQLKNIAAKL